MRVTICKDIRDMAKKVAGEVAETIRNNPNIVLGLPTGSTPEAMYKELVLLHQDQGLDFSRVITFNLDEYYGLATSHPQSYHAYMDRHLFNHVNINRKNIYIPDGMTKDIGDHCRLYEANIKRHGGIDLMLLGIGRDGHIAFNEPASSLTSRTRIKTLAPETIEDNARFFKSKDEVPRYALTMGIGTIREAKKIILMANGKNKAEAVGLTVEGPVTHMVAASALQMHDRVVIYTDEEAAAKLTRIPYYQHEEKSWLTTVEY